MNKKIAIMQPYFFPYIGYFQLINAVDKFVIYDDVNYIKRGYINKNSILGTNNNSQQINIVLNKVSQNKLINETQINQIENWRNKLLRQISHNYKKAPFFLQVFSLIEDIINLQESTLSVYLYNSVQQVCNYLNINTKIIKTSTKYQNKGLERAERLIDICKQENCFHYINTIGGQKLYYKDFFEKRNIRLSFIKAENVEYQQLSKDFIPDLSIIDVMMFNSVEEINTMLDQYTLE